MMLMWISGLLIGFGLGVKIGYQSGEKKGREAWKAERSPVTEVQN